MTRRTRLAAFAFSADREFLVESTSGSDGESLRIPVTFALYMFCTGFAFAGFDPSSFGIHLLDALSGAACVATFWLLRLIRDRALHRTLGTNIGLWVVSGMAAASAPIIVTAISGAVPDDMLAQWPVGLVTYPAVVLVLAIAISSGRSARARLRELARLTAEIDVRRASLAAELQLIRGGMKDAIRSTLRDAVRTSEQALRTDSASAHTEVARALRGIIDEVVRPLSWTLVTSSGEQNRAHANQVIIGDVKRASRSRRSSGTAAISRLPAPVLTSVMLATFVVPAGAFLDGPGGMIATSTALLLVGGALWALRQARLATTVQPVLGVAALASGSGAVASIVFGGYHALGFGLAFAPGLVAGVMLSTLAASALVALTVQRRDDQFELEVLARQRTALLYEVQQQEWVARSALATTVHGHIQSKLLIAALKLDAGSGAEEVATEALGDIADALDAVEHGDEPVFTPLGQALEQLQLAWIGACDIQLKWTVSAEQYIDAAPIARACIVEIVREVVANAAKHSIAPTIEISIDAKSDAATIVTMSPGQLTDERSAGFGSVLLDTTTKSWSLQDAADGCVYFRAEVALTSHIGAHGSETTSRRPRES